MKIRFTFFFVLINISLFAHTENIDSLLNCLEKYSGGEKISVLNQLALSYLNKDEQKTLTYAKEAIFLSDQLKFYEEMARSLNIIGVAYYNLGNYSQAIENYDKCILWGENYGSKKDVSKALYNLILLYFNQRNFIQQERVKSIFEKHWDIEKDINLYNTTVLFYSEIANDFSSETEIVEFLQEKAAKYDDNNIKALFKGGIANYYSKNQKYFYAIQFYKQALDLDTLPSVKKNLLLQISNCFFQVHKYHDGIHFLEEALVINNENEFNQHFDIYLKTMLAQNYYQLEEYSLVIEYLLPALDYLNDFIIVDRLAIVNNLSLAYLRTDSLNKAGILIEEGDKLIEKIENKSFVLAFLNTKAEFLMKKSMNKNLERTIEEIIRLSENESDNSVLYDTYSLLVKYYEANSNCEDANKYLKKLIIVNDSIKSIENQNVMNEFLVKYETEKKEKQILLQENEIQKKRAIQLLLIAGITTLAVVMVFISFILIRRNKHYKKMALNILDERNIAKAEKNQNMKVENKVNDKLLKQIRLKLDELLMAKVFLDSSLTLNKLAEMCNTNQSYLSQVINKYYGQNFNQLINNFRVREALELLSQKDNYIQLKSLYLDLGFNSYSVFNEAFKKIVGVTPGYYQKTVIGKFKNEMVNINQK